MFQHTIIPLRLLKSSGWLITTLPKETFRRQVWKVVSFLLKISQAEEQTKDILVPFPPWTNFSCRTNPGPSFQL
jgi:hypothetical protein